MHYIEYIPGTIARITEHPTRHGHEDVNLLSRHVNKFNLWAIQNPSTSNARKMELFCTQLALFQLP